MLIRSGKKEERERHSPSNIWFEFFFVEIPSRFDILLLTCGTLLPLSISVWNFIGHASCILIPVPIPILILILIRIISLTFAFAFAIRSWLILALIAAYEGDPLSAARSLSLLLTFILANILNIPCSAPPCGEAPQLQVSLSRLNGLYGRELG